MTRGDRVPQEKLLLMIHFLAFVNIKVGMHLVTIGQMELFMSFFLRKISKKLALILGISCKLVSFLYI